jgi:uncharacterized membrane protein
MENDSNQIITLSRENINIKKLAAMLIALIIICSAVMTGVIMYAPRSEGYNVLYLLDAQNQAVNYPQVLVINHNNTFNTQVFVVNNNPKPCNYQIQAKIVQDTFYFPIDAPAYETYEFTLEPKQSWNSQVPISINEVGEFSIVFELFREKGESYKFTNNYCVIHLEVVTDIS